MPQITPDARTRWVLALILFQALCALVFVVDVTADLRALPAGGWDLHIIPELAATAGISLGLAFETRYLLGLLRRQARLERQMSVAAGALQEVIEGWFRDWRLTPAEQDVAAFTIKGYSIAEIAGFRGSAEATVKTHLNAIYRKAGVSGRGQLTSLLIEDLLRGPVASPVASPATGPEGGPATGQGVAPGRQETA